MSAKARFNFLGEVGGCVWVSGWVCVGVCG